ncbi:MAG: hypothetical protein R2724_16915 [Bryobacterales bacterium]
MSLQIPVLDLIIVIAYMAGIVFVGLWVTCNTQDDRRGIPAAVLLGGP